MSYNCNHPTCFDSEECRRPAKPKKMYQLKRTRIRKKAFPRGDINALTHEELLKVAQNAVNTYVRERDKRKGCICGCGRPVEQAGHFYPAGSYSGVRFDEVNVNGISKHCNYFKPTPAIDPEYEVGLTLRFGMAAVMDLTRRAERTRFYRWDREELIAIINKYKK
jgi:hypothetical protein